MTEGGLPNGWTRYEKLVLEEIRALKEEVRALRDDQGQTRIDVAMLQVKAGVFGLVGGLLPFGLFVAYQVLGSSS